MPSHARYFRQDDISDCEVAIRWVAEATDGEHPLKRGRTSSCSPRSEELAKFPAHRIVLFTSEYFKAQVRDFAAAPGSACRCRFCLSFLEVLASRHTVYWQPLAVAPLPVHADGLIAPYHMERKRFLQRYYMQRACVQLVVVQPKGALLEPC